MDLPGCFDQPERFLDALERLQNEGRIERWRPERIELAETLLRITPAEHPG